MKKILLFLSLSLLMFACAPTDPAASADDEPVLAAATSAITVQAPPPGSDDEEVLTVQIFGYGADGTPILTPPEGSFAQMMIDENDDGDDIRVKCRKYVIYACGSLPNGGILTCRYCVCGAICQGDWCSDDMCDAGF